MKLKNPLSVKEASEFLDCNFLGDGDQLILGLNEIHVVVPGDVVFVDHPKYYDKALSSAATIVLIDKEVDCPEGKSLLIHPKPFEAFNDLIKYFAPFSPWAEKRTDVSIGNNSSVAENVVFGENVSIGDDCVIYPGVVVGSNVSIGNNVIIQSNSVLGSHAFYYKKKPDHYDRLVTCGSVRIEDNVEIGAICTIDAGVTGCTTIGEGSKIDNNVHIGHDTKIGKRALIAGKVGIAGCVTVGDDVTIWGNVGITSGVNIGDKATISGMSGVSKDLPGGKLYLGIPAGESRTKFKELAAIRSLPQIIEQL